MNDLTDAALDALVSKLNDRRMTWVGAGMDPDPDCAAAAEAITALRAERDKFEAAFWEAEGKLTTMTAEPNGKVIIDMANMPAPSPEFMAAMMPAFEGVAVQEMQKQVDALEAERDTALASESAAYARGVQAGLEKAASFCHNHSVGLSPRMGYVVGEWTSEMGGMHPGMAYALAIPNLAALLPQAGQ